MVSHQSLELSTPSAVWSTLWAGPSWEVYFSLGLLCKTLLGLLHDGKGFHVLPFPIGYMFVVWFVAVLLWQFDLGLCLPLNPLFFGSNTCIFRPLFVLLNKFIIHAFWCIDFRHTCVYTYFVTFNWMKKLPVRP